MTTPATPAADASRETIIEALDQYTRGDEHQRAIEAAIDALKTAAARESALAQQHALQIISLEAQADERESALVAERDALRAAIEDAADEWARYVEVDTAPRTLTKHMMAAFDAALAAPAVEG